MVCGLCLRPRTSRTGPRTRVPAVGQTRAFVRAHQGPVAILLDALHEEVRRQGVEQVAGALLFLTVVLLEVEEVKDVGVPRLDVDGERAHACATLVDIAGRVIEDAEHRNDAVGGAVRATDVGTGGSDVVDGEADAAGVLGNLGALLQRIVDAADAVLLHGEQEAAGHLRLGRAGIEQRRGGVGKPTLRHHVVGLDGALDVVLVDPDRDAHEHLLRALGHLPVEEVGALERLEPEVVVAEVAVVDDGGIELLGVGLDDLHDIVGHQCGVLAGHRVLVGVEVAHHLGERLFGRLVQVGYGNPGSQLGVVRVIYCIGGGHLGGEVVELGGGDPVINALDDPHGHGDWVHVLVKTVTELLHPSGDLVELDLFPASIPLDDIHLCFDWIVPRFRKRRFL